MTLPNNTLGQSTTYDIISQTFIAALTAKLTLLEKFTQDFSNDVATKGAGIVTRIPTVPSASTKTSTGSYSSTAATLTDVSLTLSNLDYVQFSLSAADMAKSMVNLEETFIQPFAFALAKTVQTNIFSAITSSAFSNTVVIPASGFNVVNIIALEASCDTLNWGGEKVLLAPATYWQTTKQDPYLLKGFKNDIKDQALEDGTIGKLEGFTCIRNNVIPTNGQNLAAFAVNKGGLIFASRPLPVQANAYGTQRIVTLESGLPVLYSQYYDPNQGCQTFRWEVLYGWASGDGSRVYRVTSA